MRKLPRQELLTINYSSRYPLASPFRALSAVTHANDGEARGLRTPRTRHLLTVTPGISGNEREKASWVPIPGERGGGGQERGANCREFTFYCARSRQTAGFFALGSLFVSYLPASSEVNACLPGRITPIVIRVARERPSIFATSIDRTQAEQKVTITSK